MASLTRNLRLRIADDLTDDARFNLERLDQLGTVFPIGSSATQTITSSGDIRLEAGSEQVYAPNLELSGDLSLEADAFKFTLQTATQSEDIIFNLPGTVGTSGQFLQTDGTDTLTWEDPPTSNLSTLEDTLFTDLQPGEIIQYNGTQWINTTIPNTRQTAIYTWLTIEGNNKTITHNFNTENIQVWIYEPGSSAQVFVQGIDYLDDNTILLTSKLPPSTDYQVHLVQTI